MKYRTKDTDFKSAAPAFVDGCLEDVSMISSRSVDSPFANIELR